MSRKAGVVLFGLLALGVGLYFLLRTHEPDPAVVVEDLTTKALDPGTEPATREQAVLALAQKGPAGKEALKRLLLKSPDANVKSSAVLGLAEMEAWDSMPLLLDALDDPAEIVRARAGASVARFIGKDYGFKASAPPEQRKAIIRIVRAEYAQMAASPPPRFQSPPSPQGNQP